MTPIPMLALAACLLASATAGAQQLRTGKQDGTGALFGDGDVVEVFVDDSGKIYKELRCHGIIPRIRDSLVPERKPGKGKRAARPKAVPKHTAVTWVGFQHKELFSRIFIQTNRLGRFTMHKPDARHIVVTIDGARIPRRNERRDVITREFKTSVDRVTARRRKGDAEIVIALSREAGYLYTQDGSYIFIDVER